MQKLAALLFFIFPITVISQNINGKVYDAETTVKGALVVNITQNSITYTDDKGDFKIKASVKDSLYVSSLFHTKAFMVIEKKHFDDIIVIEIKKAVNELDEVLLRDEREKEFDSIVLGTRLKSQIKEDMKRNPHLYSKPSANGGNILAIIGLIGKLFKKKKIEEERLVPITYQDLNTLFENDRFFNKKLLAFDLNITEEIQPLFFDYCDAKGIDSKLLAKDKQVELLEILVTCSEEFLALIEASKKQN
ncbi:hypothetical protein [uncultured Psychroserpens sp.]|uniref:hypothetical protein n=1 Tax=uncultured Psychroserpens sp. TaxID=255436 RepID=UPI0026057394|nr:hypothetical protein [uncultured Psychroserpens sp.]